MELQQAIANRRSVKKFKRDMHIDDALLYQAIEKAADAPNHGMREPWRVVHVPKDRLGDMSKDISKFAFPNELDKQCHYDAVTKLGGMLLLILKQIQDNVKMMKTTFAFGAYAQNLMLLLYEAGIGTCWKSPLYIYDPKVRKTLGIKEKTKFLLDSYI